jgi:hypothetical protein
MARSFDSVIMKSVVAYLRERAFGGYLSKSRNDVAQEAVQIQPKPRNHHVLSQLDLFARTCERNRIANTLY